MTLKEVTCNYYRIHLLGREGEFVDVNWDERINYNQLTELFPNDIGDMNHVDNQRHEDNRYRTLIMNNGSRVRLDSFRHDEDFLHLYFVKLKFLEAMQAADDEAGTEPAQLPERRYIADGCTVVINKRDNIAVIQKNRGISVQLIQEYIAHFTRSISGMYTFNEVPEDVRAFQESLRLHGDRFSVRQVSISGSLSPIDTEIQQRNETMTQMIRRIGEHFGGYHFDLVIKKATRDAPDLTRTAIDSLMTEIITDETDLSKAAIVYKDENEPRQSPLDLMSNKKKMVFMLQLDDNNLIQHAELVRSILREYEW